MKRKLIFIPVFALALGGCTNIIISKDEHQALLSENDSLRTVIQNLKHGPAATMTLISQYLSENNPINAKIAIENLIRDYPNSIEAKNANIMLFDINKEVEEINAKRTKELAEERIIKEKEIEEYRIKTEKENADRVKKATNNLRTKKDDFEGITWYHAKTTPKYIDVNNIYCYFGKKDNGTPWLKLRIQYTASDWLFIESYSIKTDNGTYDITTNYGDVKNDHSGGKIWEWIDKTPTATDYIMLRDIANSKNVTIRHNGKQYRKDRTVTAAEKQALNDLLDSFEALGGIKPKYN